MKTMYTQLLVFTCILCSLLPNNAIAEDSTALWSTRVWSAASEGDWEVVELLFDTVPSGTSEIPTAFRRDLDAFKLHRVTEQEANTLAYEEAITHCKSPGTNAPGLLISRRMLHKTVRMRPQLPLSHRAEPRPG